MLFRSCASGFPLLHGKLAIVASLSLANLRSLLKDRPPGGRRGACGVREGLPVLRSRRMLTSAARMAERRQHPRERRAGCPQRTSGDGVRAAPNRRPNPKEIAFHSACASGFPEESRLRLGLPGGKSLAPRASRRKVACASGFPEESRLRLGLPGGGCSRPGFTEEPACLRSSACIRCSRGQAAPRQACSRTPPRSPTRRSPRRRGP